MTSSSARLTRRSPLSFLDNVGICELPEEVPDALTLKSLVQAGDPEAQYIQAVLHYKGTNATLDWDLSHLLMKKSAEQGYPRAQYSFAYFAQCGIGMPVDLLLARKYYYRASLSGIPGATNNLAALQNDTVFREKYATKRRIGSPADYERPKRQPDVTFGSLVHAKRSAGQYHPHNLPRSQQKTNPLGL
jgi:hypothetical protein